MAEASDRHSRLGVGQLPLRDPEGLLGEIIRLYRRTVSEYICSEFQRRYPDEVWFMTRVIEKEKGDPRRQQAVKLMVAKFKEGKPPLRIFDSGHFPFLVQNHQEVFKDLPINSVREQMHRIAWIRNNYHGHDNEDLNNDIVEEAADKCATVLRACGKGSTANDVGRLLRGGYEAPRSDLASPSPEVADGSLPAQGVRPAREAALEPDLLRDDDLEGEDRETHRREIDTLSHQDQEVHSEREKQPFLGGALARLRMSKEARSGSPDGDGWREHKRRILAAMDIYAPAMSRYVNDRMIVAPDKAHGKAHGKEWYGVFLGKVVNDQKVKQGIREQYQTHLAQWEAGERDPSQDLEAGEFPWIVSRNSDAFPSQIRDLKKSLHTVSQKRNRATHNQRQLTPEDVDEAIDACGRIVRAIGNEAAARDIEHLRRGRFWPLEWPFFGGVLARLWASEAAQAGSSSGGGAFAADGEVDEREPVRGRRRLSVGHAILAVFLVGLAVAIWFAVPGLLSSDGESTPEPATADPGEQASHEEPSAQTPQPAPEQNPEKSDPPVPSDDPDPEPIEQGEAKLPPPPPPVPPPDVTISLSSGAGHSCRLTDDGAAACWGRNGQGQRDVLDGRFTAISAGGAHTCGLRESGSVVCWGWGEHNQLNWPSDKKFVSISAGHRHTCGITEQQDVVCWGSDEDGHDGQFSQVSAGYSHNCAITASGEVECWGTDNEQGRTAPPLGRFATVSAGQDHTCGLRHGGGVECWGGGEASESPEGSFTAISAGQFHNCGILTSGAVRCWGDNSEPPRDVQRLDDFAQIDAGAEHTCAVRTNGEIVCWGNTPHGLDNPDSANIGDHGWQGNDPPPRPAAGPAIGPAPQSTTGEDETPEIAGTFRAISAGHEHTCGLRNDGTITCWGEDSLGRTDTPAGRFSTVSAGTFHTCGLRDNGTIECWGSNSDGQRKAPTGRFSAVSAGTLHTCGLRDGGAIECWGSNSKGQRVVLDGRFTAISAGGAHTCGLRESGAVVCWGSNEYEESKAPAGRFSAVSAGTLHTCGLRTNGAIECWGNPGSERNNVPEGKFNAVSAGYGHACGLRDDGAIRCWGDNSHGQSDAPAGRFNAVSAGHQHTCGLRDNGTIKCW